MRRGDQIGRRVGSILGCGGSDDFVRRAAGWRSSGAAHKAPHAQRTLKAPSGVLSPTAQPHSLPEHQPEDRLANSGKRSLRFITGPPPSGGSSTWEPQAIANPAIPAAAESDLRRRGVDAPQRPAEHGASSRQSALCPSIGSPADGQNGHRCVRRLGNYGSTFQQGKQNQDRLVHSSQGVGGRLREPQPRTSESVSLSSKTVPSFSTCSSRSRMRCQSSRVIITSRATDPLCSPRIPARPIWSTRREARL